MYNGQKVRYSGTAQLKHRNRYGVTCSEVYEIREWNFVNVLFENDEHWHPINIENLTSRE